MRGEAKTCAARMSVATERRSVGAIGSFGAPMSAIRVRRVADCPTAVWTRFQRLVQGGSLI